MKRKIKKNYDFRKRIEYLKFIQKKPIVASTLAWVYFQIHILKKSTIRTVDLTITYTL